MVGPKARELKARMKSDENADNTDALKSEFDSLHGWSVRLNATVLVFGLGLLWVTVDSLKL